VKKCSKGTIFTGSTRGEEEKKKSGSNAPEYVAFGGDNALGKNKKGQGKKGLKKRLTEEERIRGG